MTTNFTDFLGTKPKLPMSIAEFYPSSITWTCYYTGWYRLSALGAGGSGGAIYRSAADFGAATGGGGGAFAEKEVYLTVGDTLTFVVGAGGARAYSSVDGTGVNGNDGGETTIHGASGSAVCTAINIHAPGGLHGHFTIIDHEAILGGLGASIATGGDFNAAGGRGGDLTFHNTSRGGTGGGAAGSPYGTGGRGGDITGTNPASTGGGAVGGFHGGDNSTYEGATGGGGTAGDGIINTSTGGVNRFLYGAAIASGAGVDGLLRAGGTPQAATNVASSFDSLNDPFRGLSGGCTGGGGGQGGSGAGGGAGGGGVGGAGGVLGGGGGCYAWPNSTVMAGIGGVGGGGGGTAHSSACYSGAGGTGLITVERIG